MNKICWTFQKLQISAIIISVNNHELEAIFKEEWTSFDVAQKDIFSYPEKQNPQIPRDARALIILHTNCGLQWAREWEGEIEREYERDDAPAKPRASEMG